MKLILFYISSSSSSFELAAITALTPSPLPVLDILYVCHEESVCYFCNNKQLSLKKNAFLVSEDVSERKSEHTPVSNVIHIISLLWCVYLLPQQRDLVIHLEKYSQ